jgi:hypothetical protein
MPITNRHTLTLGALWLPVAVVALLWSVVPAVAADPLTGVWHGTGTQYPPGRDPDWTIVMTINDHGGSIDYPSLSCGGTLTQLSRDANSAQFRETIVYGQQRCVDGGTITVRLVNGKLTWSYTGSANGKQFTANAKVTATLIPREPTADAPH